MVVCGGEILVLYLTADTVYDGYCVDVTFAIYLDWMGINHTLLSEIFLAKAVADGGTFRTSYSHQCGKSIYFLIGNLRLSYSFY